MNLLHSHITDCRAMICSDSDLHWPLMAQAGAWTSQPEHDVCLRAHPEASSRCRKLRGALEAALAAGFFVISESKCRVPLITSIVYVEREANHIADGHVLSVKS